MRQSFAIAIVCVVVAAAWAGGSDWPQGSFDAGNTRYNTGEAALGTSNVGSLELAWAVPMGGIFFGMPIVADGRVYSGGGDGRLHAYDEISGAELWSGPVEAGLFIGSPAYADGIVVAGADGPLRAYDAETGAVLWSTAGHASYRSSPVVVGDVVYATRFLGRLSAFDAKTGAVLWSASGDCCVFDQGPAVDDGRVFQMRTNGSLTAYDAATGAELWVIDAFAIGPATAANGKVFWNDAPDVVAVDQVTGDEIWRAPVLGAGGSGNPAVAGGLLFAQGGTLVALDEDTGVVAWSFPAAGGWGPSVANGVVYASDWNGVWSAFDQEDGSLLWSIVIPGCSGTCSIAPPVVANGTLFLSGPDASMRAYRPPFELSIAGACPGEITVEISGAAPNGRVLLVSSETLGSFAVPGGPCAGTEVGLESPKVLTRMPADAAGAVSFTRNVGHGSCASILQAVDLNRCVTSETFEIP